MNEEYRYPDQEPYATDEFQIDWMGLIAKFLKGWKLILAATVLFAALGIVLVVCRKPEFKVTVTLAPESQRAGTATAGGISSMLGMGGNAGVYSSDALNISLVSDICRSTPFLTGLFPVELTPSEPAPEGPESITVLEYMYKASRPTGIKKLWRTIRGKKDAPITDRDTIVDISRLNYKQRGAVRALGETISASFNGGSGLTKITVVMDDPLMAAQLADTVCRRLQDYLVRYKTQKATADYEYYVKITEEARENMIKAQSAYAASVDNDRNIILQSVNTRRERLRQEAELTRQLYVQMAQRRDLARAKIQEEKPIFAVVQPSAVPGGPSNGQKKVIFLLAFLGFFLSSLWVVFGKDLVSKVRTGVKEKMKEEEKKPEGEDIA